MPIYKVTNTIEFDDKNAVSVRLIDAKSQAKALAHATAKHMTVEKATSDDLIVLTKSGVELEKATESP